MKQKYNKLKYPQPHNITPSLLKILFGDIQLNPALEPRTIERVHAAAKYYAK